MLVLRARCAEKLGEREQAQELYEQALCENHFLPHAHFRLGRLRMDAALKSVL